MSIQQAYAELSTELTRAIVEGDGCIPESDSGVNNASRALVQAFVKENGSAWVGKVNPYDVKADGEPLRQVVAEEMIYNFGADFVIPQYDAMLAFLIKDRLAAPYTGTKADAVWIDKIHARIELLGGRHLFWS